MGTLAHARVRGPTYRRVQRTQKDGEPPACITLAERLVTMAVALGGRLDLSQDSVARFVEFVESAAYPDWWWACRGPAHHIYGIALRFGSRARSQVLIYHFMFGPSYADDCPVNSSIADAFDSLIPHPKARDVSLPRPISDFTIRQIQHALGNHGPELAVTIAPRQWLT